MPALEVLGRRWYIASDDFVIPEACDVIFRSTCFAIVGVMFWNNYATINESCGGQFYINAYVYGSLFLTSLVICSNIALIFQSKSGSIVINNEKRKYVPVLFICKWILQITELAWNIIGTIWVIQKKLTCTSEFDAFLTGLVIVSWMLIFFRLLILYLCFNSIGRLKYTVQNNGEPNPKLVKEWQRKWLKLSFLLTGKPLLIKQGLEKVGYFFGLALDDDTEYVLSDIVAGAILLFHRESEIQKSKQRLTNNGNLNSEKVPEDGKANSVESEELKTLNSSLPALESWDSLSQIHHYLKYGIASYTWVPMLAFGGVWKVKDLLKEAIGCLCLPCCRKRSFHIEGDIWCFLHSAGLKAFQFENMEIIYADYKNTIFEVPFFVSADHAKQTIVISVRGTYSLNDIIVDLNGMPHQMGVPGLPESFKMHHGMLICAQLIKEKLDRLQLLPKLFATYPNYNLIFTGISLGAGVATGLSFMFKDAYPSLKCYSISPPGYLLSEDAVDYSKNFVISITYGDDAVCRISNQSIENEKHRTVEALSACRTPKYRIFLGAIYALCGGTPKFQYDENSSFYKTYNSQLCGNSENGGDLHITLNDEPENVTKLQLYERMYPPGNLVYVRETENFPLGQKNPNYKGAPRWTIHLADKSEFTELFLTSRLAFDHIPLRLNRALNFFCDNGNS